MMADGGGVETGVDANEEDAKAGGDDVRDGLVASGENQLGSGTPRGFDQEPAFHGTDRSGIQGSKGSRVERFENSRVLGSGEQVGDETARPYEMLHRPS